MNKHLVQTLGTLEVPPPNYNLDDFVSKVAEIDDMLVAGKLSYEFVLPMLDIILKAHNFPVWKTLRVNRWHRKPARYSQLLTNAGCVLEGYVPIPLFFHDDSVEKLRYKHESPTDDLEVDVVRVSPRDLGFLNVKGVKRSVFYTRAIEFGLEKSWYEIAFALRLKYTDQPPGEWLTVATETTSVDVPGRLLRVGHGRREDPLCIATKISDSDTLVMADEAYIFIKPRWAHT